MTKIRSIQKLSEGITHLEDLDVQAFVRAVTNIAKMRATEKLDGAELSFGLDDEGKFYTTRAQKRKNSENIYDEKEYPYFAAYNGFRAAHAALKEHEADIKLVLRPGDMVEVEVLYGRQPNAVTYGAGGKNYIAFLRGLGTTQDILVDQLANTLANVTAVVKVNIVETDDGQTLKLTPTDVSFQFVGAQKIDTANLKTTDIGRQIEALDRFLKTRIRIGTVEMTNFDLVTASLVSIDKTVRAEAKALKAKVLAQIMSEFKLPIKKELLDKFVGKIKSPLAADDLSQDEDIGIEGVVLKDPDSGEQIKLVDKDAFTTINQFNHAVRGSISGTIKTLDPNASIEARGGMMGELKITIADLLGNVELARTQTAKKIFATLKGKDAVETVKNVTKQLQGGEDYRATQRKVEALIAATREKVAGELNDFKQHKDDFKLKLKSGKTMGLSAEVIRRTLTAFAENKRDLDELSKKIAGTKTLQQLVALLYGRIAKAVHDVGDEVEQVAEARLVPPTYVWTIFLHPEKNELKEVHVKQFAGVMAALKSFGTVKITEMFDDDDDDGGYEFQLKTTKKLSENEIWDRLADEGLAWGGNIHYVKAITEDILTEKRIHTDVDQYRGKDAFTIMNTYFATYLMSAIIFLENDTQGIRLLRDKTHMRLQRWDKEMSALNFWGYAVWRSGTPAVKKLIGKKNASDLFRYTRHVPQQLWRFLHIDLSYGKETNIEWEDHQKAFKMLQYSPGMYSTRINTLMVGIFRYALMTLDEKVKFQNTLFNFMQSFVGISPLSHRLRVIMNTTLINANGESPVNGDMVQEMKLLQQVSALSEDGEAASATIGSGIGSAAGGNSPIGPGGATNAASISNVQNQIFGKQPNTVMRRRSADAAKFRIKFPRPRDNKDTQK